MSARSRIVVPLLLISSLLAACGGGSTVTDDASSGSATHEPPAESTAAAGTATDGDGATDAPSFPADASPDTADASADASVTVSDIRIGAHDGFDRVVFEVGGTGTPGWDVRYVEEATSQGSGEPVDVAGDAVLQVTLTGAGYPYDTGVDEYAGPDPLSAGTDVVTEVAFDATFEGTTVSFIGTSAERPFRVYLLEGPTRVVVEVAAD